MDTPNTSIEPQNELLPEKKPQTNLNELSYEHSIAYYIVGKLVLDGALDPTNFNCDIGGERESDPRVPFVVNSIAAALLEGLSAFGWRGGGVAELLNAADYGSLHMKSEGLE